MINPYDILGLDRTAGDSDVRAAFKKQAKSTHPDAGGETEAFVRGQKAAELLLDPLRRKVFDATGYDPALADPADLQSVIVIEKLVNEIVLDEREPGSFDPLLHMRKTLNDDIVKARRHIKEMEAHIARIAKHIDRLEKRPETDLLGHMLRARIELISEMNQETAKQIAATERALRMLDGYSYMVEPANEEERRTTSR